LPLSFNCWYGECKYTSARLITKQKFNRKYGRFEARIKIPRGQGMWSAFWLLGSNIDTVGWANCGEIDVMENIGREPLTVHGTIHGPGYSGANGIGAPFSLANDQKFSDDFHVYATEWTENKISFYVDGTLYKTITPQDLPAGKQWVYDHPFFMILNLAIGGKWGGAPDEITVFPQTMLVDYVRVYRR
jgi:beta-glucanase (GH16 family)